MTTVNIAIADIVTYTIVLTTGQQATVGQVDGWGSAIQNGIITEQGMVDAFVASSAFATYNNGGVIAIPNAAPTILEATNVIDHALGSATTTQVNGWVNSGEMLGQMVDAFVHNSTFQTLVNTNEGASTSLQIPQNQETPLAATPLPDALPLLTAGLCAFSLLGWRKRRQGATATVG